MNVRPRNVCPIVVGGVVVGFGFDLGPIHVDTDKGVKVDDPVKFIAHAMSDASKGVATFMKDPVGTSLSIADQAKTFAEEYASNMAGVVSLIPGIGTPISSAIEAGLATLAGGSPLDIAIHAAYGMIPIPPGIKSITDKILNVALSIADQLMAGKPLDQTIIDTILKQVPSGIPFARQVADTIIHLIVGALSHHETVAPSHAIAAHPKPTPKKLTASMAKTGTLPVRKVIPVRPPPPRAVPPPAPPKVLKFHMGPVVPPGAVQLSPPPVPPPPPLPQTTDTPATLPAAPQWVCQLGPNASYECGWV